MKRPATLFLLCAMPTLASAFSPRADLEAGRYLQVLRQADYELKTNAGSALAWAARSQACTALMRLPEALASAQRALELQPGLPDGLLARALARAGLAVQARNLSSLSGASASLEDLRAAVQGDPSLVTGWMTLGLAYEALPGILGGSTRRALACAESLKRVRPTRGEVLQGTILAMEGKWWEAEACFQRALAADPRDPETVYAYLDALSGNPTRKKLGETEVKRRLSLEARRLLPGVKHRARGVQAVCDALLDADLGEEAWRVAKESLPGLDAPSLGRLQLGKVSARSGVHPQEALAYLDQVLREPLEGGSGGYGTAHWRRGQVLRTLGRIPEARAAAQAALNLDPKDPKPARLLKELP